MAVRIRLARYGAKKTPYYRIVAADGQARRDGRFLELLGTYDPSAATDGVRVDRARYDHWVGVGATPSDTVANLVRKLSRAGQ